MRPGGFVGISYWSDSSSSWVDVSDGVITVNTKTGADFFQGFWDQTDVGQFSILSRNSSIDPNANSEIRFNTVVRLMTEPDTANERSIFYGFITDVNVEYLQNEEPRITLTGTDLIGFLNRLVITQDFLDTNILPDYPDAIVPIDYLIYYITSSLAPEIAAIFVGVYASRYGFLFEEGELFENSFGFVAPGAPLVKVEVGKTFYELMINGCATGMIRLDNLTGSLYRFTPYYKHDSAFYVKGNTWAPPEETALAQFYFKSSPTDEWQNGFTSGPEDLTYKFININDGFDRLVNQITVNNTNPSDLSSQTFPASVDDASLSTWGPAKLDISTTFSPDSNSIWLASATVEQQAIEYNKDIFDYQAIPKMNVVSITMDMTKQFNYDYYPYYPDNGSEFYIQHKVGPNNYLEGYYVVSGVRHTITDDSWFAEFVLRESEYRIYDAKKPKIPTIQLSATSGTTADTFTASITNYTTAELNDLEAIEWMVNLPGGWLPTAPPSQLFNLNKSIYDETSPFTFTGVPTFTNNTVSWTYDDGGALAGYPDALHGPGQYGVAVWVRNKDGYTSCGWAGDGTMIGISGATAHADFLFTKNASEEVTFYNMSGADSNTWEWDFGDGTTYSGQNPPKKNYATSGTYNVSLAVFNGFTTTTITKPIVITIYQIPVRYIRFRYQGSVTKPAGAEDYTTDLIDTIGLVELLNESGTQTGGIQPMYFSRIATLDKVEDIGRGHWGAPVYDPVNRGQYLDSYGNINTYDCYVPEVPPPSGQVYDDYYEYPLFAAADILAIDGSNPNTYVYDNGPNNDGVDATLTFPNPITMINGIDLEGLDETIPVLIVGNYYINYNGGDNYFMNVHGGIYLFDPATPTIMTRDPFYQSVVFEADMWFSVDGSNKILSSSQSGAFVHLATNNTLGSIQHKMNWPDYIGAIPAYTYEKTYVEDIVLGTTAGITGYYPNYSTNYASGGQLDPMSQSMRQSWNVIQPRGTFGGQYPKYKFHPVITNNPDGSQTKTLDVDVIIEYSQTYNSGTSSSSISSAWRRYFNNQPAGLNATGGGNPKPALSYLPGGVTSRLVYWNNWGAGTTGFNERYKLKQIKIWPGRETTGFDTSTGQITSSNAIGDCDVTGDVGYNIQPIISEFGVTNEKTYLPISIAVSDDGVTYRKVGTATYTSGNVMSTTYVTPMPPWSNAPVEA